MNLDLNEGGKWSAGHARFLVEGCSRIMISRPAGLLINGAGPPDLVNIGRVHPSSYPPTFRELTTRASHYFPLDGRSLFGSITLRLRYIAIVICILKIYHPSLAVYFEYLLMET